MGRPLGIEFQSFLIGFFALIFFVSSIFINLFIAILPLFNFLIFMFWCPLLICLLGVRFRDIYQLVPILLQLTFLLSPILYMKENLGNLLWIVNLNPIYLVISQLRDSIIEGRLNFIPIISVLFMNFIGVIFSLLYLNRLRSKIPFLL